MPRESDPPPIFSPPYPDTDVSSHPFVFPPNSPLSLPSTPCSSPNSGLEPSQIATVYHARLLLQNHLLRHRYSLCRAHLRDVLQDSESLLMQNAELRRSNQELVNKLGLFGSRRNLLPEFRRLGGQDPSSAFVLPVSPPTPSVIYKTNNNTSNITAAALPKSISVRSTGYRKSNPSPLDVDRGYAGRQEEMEVEVYDQGMVKTELCIKWQETGGCWYGESCQFAHGIKELRPVIRHPRYKTQVCKVVLRGGRCPYAHRCHFRHALTDQERLLGLASLPLDSSPPGESRINYT